MQKGARHGTELDLGLALHEFYLCLSICLCKDDKFKYNTLPAVPYLMKITNARLHLVLGPLAIYIKQDLRRYYAPPLYAPPFPPKRVPFYSTFRRRWVAPIQRYSLFERASGCYPLHGNFRCRSPKVVKMQSNPTFSSKCLKAGGKWALPLQFSALRTTSLTSCTSALITCNPPAPL